MKLLRISYRMLADELWKTLLLMAQVFLFVFFINISVGILQEANNLSRQAERMELSDQLFFSFHSQYFIELTDQSYLGNHALEEQLDAALSKEVPGFVARAATAHTSAKDAARGENVSFHFYEGPLLERARYELQEGRWLSEKSVNEGVISADLADFYRVGDVVPFTFQQGLPVQVTVPVKIIGILEEDERILHFMSGGASESLDKLFTEPSACILVHRVQGETGTPVSRSTPMASVILTDRSYQQAPEQRQSAEYGSLLSVAAMEAATNAYNAHRVTQQLLLAGLLLLLAAVGIGTNHFVALLSREKEFAVYYMCGLSWRSCTLLLTLRSALLLGLPALLAVALLQVDAVLQPFGALRIGWGNILISVLLLAAVYGLTSLPLHWKMRRMSPVVLFHKE